MNTNTAIKVCVGYVVKGEPLNLPDGEYMLVTRDELAALEAAQQQLAQRGGSGAAVAYADPHAFVNFERARAGKMPGAMGREWMWARPDTGLVPLYTAPPAAVQPDSALRTATELAKAIWRDNYKADAPDWEPLPDLMGVLSQIDNMVCGMRRGAVDKFSQPDSGRDAALKAILALAEHLVMDREHEKGEGRTLAEMEADDELPGAIKMGRAAMAAQQGEQAPAAK